MENKITELKDTVDLMLSDNYEDRFMAELHQVRIRIDKLEKVLSCYDASKFKTPKPLLQAQYEAMRSYETILKFRLECNMQ